MSTDRKRVRLLPLAVAQFCGITALFTHIALTSVLSQTWITESNAMRANYTNVTGINATAAPLPPAAGEIPDGLATLPLAMLILFSALAIAPAGARMQHVGYRPVFFFGTALSALSAGLCFLAVVLYTRQAMSPIGAFILLTVAVVPQGCSYGIVHYYRHVAAVVGKMEAEALGLTSTQATARAVAIVITSGALAGVVGPALADGFNNVIPSYRFAGTYVALAVFAMAHCGVLFLSDVDAAFPSQRSIDKKAAAEERRLKDPSSPTVASPLMNDTDAIVVVEEEPKPTPTEAPPRPLGAIALTRAYMEPMLTAAAAHSSMVTLMAVAPLLLHAKGVPFSASSGVIQVHVLCMYLPSFGTSKFIARTGTAAACIAGLVVALLGAILLIIVPTLRSVAEWNYYGAVMVCLALVGVGWNLAFVGATTAVAAAYHPNEKFKAQSLNDTVVFSCGSLCTLVAGPLLHHFGVVPLASGAVVLYTLALIGNAHSFISQRRARKAAIEAVRNGEA